ncbi:hypothetical protein CYV15_05305 [Riemerella anatipestifer]|nr:hypothetical protein RIA_0597 [Riemerella anatipestifer RA-GD]AGC41303.1 hypothetical protein G148_1999 [Riemerella anatipestifer RA-CH-2]AKQ40342.1 hypothetical protein AS87_08495 [Riemerella anatipestifer Yb2]MDD1524997.1 hypothetical protein [Riemerella anatipestifer]MDD1598189.1 hypothetical protein [Riemerella anatipestifer]
MSLVGRTIVFSFFIRIIDHEDSFLFYSQAPLSKNFHFPKNLKVILLTPIIPPKPTFHTSIPYHYHKAQTKHITPKHFLFHNKTISVASL